MAPVERDGVVLVGQEPRRFRLRFKRLGPMDHPRPITQRRLVRHRLHNLRLVPRAMRIEVEPTVVLRVVGPRVEIADPLRLSKSNVIIQPGVVHTGEQP